MSEPNGCVRAFAIDLLAGETASVKRELKLVTRYGQIRISCACFANVYFKGAVIGRAGTSDTMRLPVGHQRLTLINPKTKATWIVDVDVEEGTVAKSFPTAPPGQ